MPNIAADRSFYEAKWSASDNSSGSLRNYMVRKERFFVRQLRGKSGRVLDLGCGGGWKLYTRVGSVVGVDISHASLQSASRLYAGAALADLTALPFADASFDLVVSTDVLGHVRLKDKDAVLGEIWRVLAPGGHTMHYIEVDGNDPLMRFAKRYPDLYQKYIILPEGHVGLETPDRWADRFRRLGFRAAAEIPSYRGLTYVRRIVQYFGNEFSGKSFGIRWLVLVCRLLTVLRPVETAANLLLSLMIEVGDRVLPASWAGGLLVCYQKEA